MWNGRGWELVCVCVSTSVHVCRCMNVFNHRKTTSSISACNTISRLRVSVYAFMFECVSKYIYLNKHTHDTRMHSHIRTTPRARMYAHTRTRIYMHADCLFYSVTHSLRVSFSQTQTLSHKHTHTHTHTYTNARTLSHTLFLTRTYA